MDQIPRTRDSWAKLLEAAEAGAAGAKESFFVALYSELHELAERQLRRERDIVISPTTLLHETYLGMSEGDAVFPDRARFMGYAARVMRSLIIESHSRLCRSHHVGKRSATRHNDDAASACRACGDPFF